MYLRDIADFGEMREAYRKQFSDGYPARMTATTDFRLDVPDPDRRRGLQAEVADARRRAMCTLAGESWLILDCQASR